MLFEPMSEQLVGIDQQVKKLEKDWATNPRWKGIKRDYTAEDVIIHRPSIDIEYSLSKHGTLRFTGDLSKKEYVLGLGTNSGINAIDKIEAGFADVFYLSGWQNAGTRNSALKIYPDLSLYPWTTFPNNITELNNAMQMADIRERVEGKYGGYNWYLPIMADLEAGGGSKLHAWEITAECIKAGVAGVHFEDQLSGEKKCGHLAGKVIVPVMKFIDVLNGGRMASDVTGVPIIIMARTDAMDATLLDKVIDRRDEKFLTGKKTEDGYYIVKGGLDAAIDRSLYYAPYADMLWFETKTPDLDDAKRYTEAIKHHFPDKLLAYNCSPSMKWDKFYQTDEALLEFIPALAKLGYKFPFVTLFDYHVNNTATFAETRAFLERGMAAFAALQRRGFAMQKDGYRAIEHQREVGTKTWDHLSEALTGRRSSTTAFKGSTEDEQFQSANL